MSRRIYKALAGINAELFKEASLEKPEYGVFEIGEDGLQNKAYPES